MTEDEAKTKWCPFARVATIISSGKEIMPVSGNRVSVADGLVAKSEEPSNPPSARCIASACMAWRSDFITMTTNHPPFREEKLREGWTDIGNGRIKSPPTNYCGLAGKPS